MPYACILHLFFTKTKWSLALFKVFAIEWPIKLVSYSDLSGQILVTLSSSSPKWWLLTTNIFCCRLLFLRHTYWSSGREGTHTTTRKPVSSLLTASGLARQAKNTELRFNRFPQKLHSEYTPQFFLVAMTQSNEMLYPELPST